LASTSLPLDQNRVAVRAADLVRLSRWAREPLVHFMAIGLALFVVSRVVAPSAPQGDRLTRVEITSDDIRQLQIGWMSQWQRPPTPPELAGLIDVRVREEILYREALALGLERDDTIVKRRLAQKMEFLAEDVSAIPQPTDGVLRAWFERNQARFAEPGRVSLRHVYFAADRKGIAARDAALAAMPLLAAAPRGAIPAGVGDRFMFQDYYGDRTPDQIAGVFGTTFATAVFQRAARHTWQGPVESGLGQHLIWIESMSPGRVPAFEEIPEAVRAEWMAEQRVDTKKRAYEAMRKRYHVTVASAPALTLPSSTGAPATP
jgi:peptidyl-prolyl cis-trans isomerase C